MSHTLIALPDTKRVEESSALVVHQAESLSITTAGQYSEAAEFLKGLKGLQREIDDTFAPGIESAHKTHKTLLATRDMHLKPLQEAEKLVKAKMLTFQAAERRRAEEEARARAEEARRLEQERLLAEAVVAEADGDTRAVESIMLDAVQVQAPVIKPQPETPKVSGIAIKATWKAEVIDMQQLIKAAAVRPDLAALLIVNQSALNKLAGAMRDQLMIPGVRAYKEETIASRIA